MSPLLTLLRLPALLLDIPICSFSPAISVGEQQKIMDTLEVGDILLTADKLFPLWRVAVGVMGSPKYSHAAIYEGDNQVIEATTFHPSGDGVARTALHDFLSGRKNIGILRPQYPTQRRKNAMLTWLRGQLGKPYDYSFSYGNDRAMYCAKLVGKAMQTAGIQIDTKCFTKSKLYLPDCFMQTKEMKVVYRKSEIKRRQLLYSLPFLPAIPAFFTNSLLALILWSSVLLLMIAVGWLQHLKKI